jgi:hypothetical protein
LSEASSTVRFFNFGGGLVNVGPVTERPSKEFREIIKLSRFGSNEVKLVPRNVISRPFPERSKYFRLENFEVKAKAVKLVQSVIVRKEAEFRKLGIVITLASHEPLESDRKMNPLSKNVLPFLEHKIPSSSQLADTLDGKNEVLRRFIKVL